MVRWKIACREKRNRGLRIKNISILNKALLDKWNWRFVLENKSLWRWVIVRKYREEKWGWCFKESRGAF